MGVHARAVVAEKGLGHQADGLAVAAGHVLDDILVKHHVVGRLDQRVKPKINFGLAAGRHLMVLALDLDAQFLHHQAHLGADVLLGVVGGDRKITLLVADFVAQVGGFVPPAVPDRLLRVHRVKGAVALGVELDVVKNKKFGLRPEDGLVGQPGGLEIFLGVRGDAAGIAGVGLLGAGLGDGAGQGEGRHGAERVNESGVGIGHGQHVGGFDGFPAADGRAVKAVAVGEDLLGQLGDGQAEMLPGSEGVNKLNINHFGALLFRQGQNALGGVLHVSYWVIGFWGLLGDGPPLPRAAREGAQIRAPLRRTLRCGCEPRFQCC